MMRFSNKDLFTILFPLLIEQTFVVFVGIADTMMVSSVGEAAVSGVALADSISNVLLFLVSGLATGGAVLCSQNIGRGDIKMANESAKQLLVVCTFFMLIISGACMIFNRQIITFLYSKAEAQVLSNARKYFYVTASSFVFQTIYTVYAVVFRAMGNSKISLKVSVIVNIINLSGNAIGVFVLKAGVYGVAVPTLVARIAGSVIIVAAMAHSNCIVKINLKEKFRPDWAIIKKVVEISLPAGVENSLFQGGKLILQSLVSSLGTSATTAYAVANSLATFEYIPGSAFSMGIPAITGQCMGAGEYKQAKKYTLKIIGWQYIGILIISLAICIFIKPILSLYSLSGQTFEITKSMIYLHSVIILVHPFAFLMVHALRSASDVKFPMVVSVVSMLIFRVGFAYLFVRKLNTGVVGVWYAMFIDWAVRAAIYATRFFSGKWQEKIKKENIDLKTNESM